MVAGHAGVEMSIVEQVSQQMKDAMRAKDKPRLAALRGMRAAFLNDMKADGSDSLSDEAAVELLRRLAKQRRESITAYEEGGRDDLAGPEKEELAVIEEFLPKLMDEAQTRVVVEAAIAKTGASTPRDMGKVMGVVMKQHKGQVDGGLVRQLATALLGG